MIISRHRSFKVSMGNYENYTFGASVTLSHQDMGYDDDMLAEYIGSGPIPADAALTELAAALTARCESILGDLLVAEIRDAADLTEEKRSFILTSFVEPSIPEQGAVKTVRRKRA